jgi:hypothetical protein
MQGIVEPAHNGIALPIAEGEDILQRNSDMQQVFLNIGTMVVLLMELSLAMQILCKPPCALLHTKLDLLEDLRIRLDGLLRLRRVGTQTDATWTRIAIGAMGNAPLG